MILQRRFGLAPLAAAIFATGVMVGTSLPAAWQVRSLTASAVASPGAGLPNMIAAMPRYPAEVVRVVDGDTFEARVRVWPGIEIATKVRLRSIDAPEMRGRCEQEYRQAQAARDALAALLAQGAVSIAQVSLDKYGGRVLADASTGRTGDVASALLEAGLVRRYSGGRREPWC